MKRSDRLAAIVMALQTGTETAQSLADKFEVSKRTILRDMQALSEMGVPFYALSGPVGGYRLMDGYKLPPLQFSSLEAMTVLCALQGMTQLVDAEAELPGPDAEPAHGLCGGRHLDPGSLPLRQSGALAASSPAAHRDRARLLVLRSLLPRS
ncbi:YafY family protein [Paenibacillus thiaminolyticus]|uniref:HTH domain-containing protein n=1 Tax=Paenibacillus thiaminolyticus TaxID=49283 RepID=A0A3A3GH01_PANTH|nr:HTH domain-containing protein [Paenibacillus thiaminolyticus]